MVLVAIALIVVQLGLPLSSQPTSMKTWTYPSGFDPHGGYIDQLTYVVNTWEQQLGPEDLRTNVFYAWDAPLYLNDIAELENSSDIEITHLVGSKYPAFVLDCQELPLNITGYRRAIAYGFNKYEVIAQISEDLVAPLDGVIPLSNLKYCFENNFSEHYYGMDILKANASLEGSGFRDLDEDGWREYDANNNSLWDIGDIDDNELELGIGITAGHTKSEIITSIFVDCMKQCGLHFYVFEKDMWWDPVEGDFDPGPIHLLWFNLPSQVPDYLGSLFPDSWSWFQYRFSKWLNATFDFYVENLLASENETMAQFWAWKSQELLWYEQPMIVCYNDVVSYAYRTDIWEGYVNPHGASFYNAWTFTHIRLREEAGGPFGCYPTEYLTSLSSGMETTNVMKTRDSETNYVLMNVYSQLWQVDPLNQDKVPDLAYAWEFESTEASGDIRDGQKWIFHLYENVTWHDGVPLNASDVAFTFEELAPQDPYHAKYLTHIYRIDTPDEYTVEMYTNQTKYFEFCHATNYNILPQHIWQHVSDPYTCEPETPLELTGSGPYQWGSRSPGNYIHLYRNPRWHFRVEQPPRIQCPLSGLQWVQLIIVSLGVIVILILTGILGYLIQRRSGRKSIKKSKSLISTQWRVD